MDPYSLEQPGMAAKPRPTALQTPAMTPQAPQTSPFRLGGAKPGIPTGMRPARPLTNRVGDGFNPMTPQTPAKPAPAPVPSPGVQPTGPGGIITSTAGDGFGSPPVGGGPANAPAPMPMGGAPLVDRFALAQDRWNQYATASEPQYQSALRDANRLGAAGGQLGSGELRTDFGNLADARGRDLTTQGRGFLSDALEGTIGDNQRGFENELASLGLSDDLTNSAFGRALSAYGAGTANNPSGTGLAVGASQGANATRSAQSFADLMRSLGLGSPGAGQTTPLPGLPAPEATTNNTAELPDWLRTIMQPGNI